MAVVFLQVSGGLEKLDLHGAAFQCLDNTSFPLLPRLKDLNLMYCRIAAVSHVPTLRNITYTNTTQSN